MRHKCQGGLQSRELSRPGTKDLKNAMLALILVIRHLKLHLHTYISTWHVWQIALECIVNNATKYIYLLHDYQNGNPEMHKHTSSRNDICIYCMYNFDSEYLNE